MNRGWTSAVARIAATVVLATASAGALATGDAPSATTADGDIVSPVRFRFNVPGDTVAFHGVASYDDAGLNDAPVLYVGGPIGLVVGVIAHSVISNSRRQRQKDEITAQADIVLEPYADAIADLRQRDLLERSFATMTTVADKSIGDPGATADTWVVDYVPVFAMNQDRRALVLDNAVSITRPDGPAGTGYRNTVRVVSLPRPDEDIDWWGADQAANLRSESARLLALSFDVALAEARRGPSTSGGTPTQRTLRFQVGASERMERAELIGQTCERVVMRTLRGWLLSAPLSRPAARDSDGHPCATAVAATPG